MRILVTGGAGMVGSHAAEYWAARGHDVIVLDNLMRSALFGSQRESVEYNWHYLERVPRVRRIKGDVRHPDDIRRALQGGVDAVLHTAGQPGVGYSLADPREDFSINAEGTLHVLEAVRRTCPRAAFLYCSTNKVYGENVSALALVERKTRYAFGNGFVGVPEDFSVDLTGHTPYGVSKLVGDLYAQDYAHTFGMRTGVFRMSCIYGARQFGFEDQGWIAHFTIATLLGRPITIYGDGKQVRDVLYVEDLVRAFDRFLTGGTAHGVFNIGGGVSQTLSLLELLEHLEQLISKRSRVTYADWRPSDQKVYVSDIARAQRALGWQPQIGVEEGLRRVVGWVTEHRDYFG